MFNWFVPAQPQCFAQEQAGFSMSQPHASPDRRHPR
jgi:hypothetical protein